MNILALELSSRQGSIAWIEGGNVAFTRIFANDRKHSGLFFQGLQDWAGQFAQPDRIVVGVGPGSYAGVRIAIATALGLRASMMTRLIGIPSVCALEVPEFDYSVIGDARRDSFFLGHVDDGRLTKSLSLYSSDDLAAKVAEIHGPIYVSESLPQFPMAIVAYPSARKLAELACREKDELIESESLEPIYLREPYITVPKKIPVATIKK